jgi:flagellar biosynthesis protein
MNKKTDKKADIAITLQYDGKNAPRVTAKGEDEIASRIKAIAKEHDIPLYEDAILAQVLSQIDLGEEIPRSLYVTVAQVIAFSYLMAERICPVPQQPRQAKKSPPLLTSSIKNEPNDCN